MVIGSTTLALVAALVVVAEPSGSVAELEAELRALYAEKKWVTARRLGEELLDREESSIVGHLVMGTVYWEADADFSKARYHLGHAEDLYESAYADDMGTDWRLHSDIVQSLVWLSGEMDRQEEQLDWIAHFNLYFQPPLLASMAWPLMELGRYDEAKEMIAQGLASDRYVERLRAHNSNCAIQAEMGMRQASYDACRASFRHSREVGDSDITVVARNAADSARAMLYFDEAERLIDVAATGSAESSTNPPMFKTVLLLDQARGGEALVEAQTMLRWHLRQPPTMRSSSRAQLDASLAELFLLAGDEARGRAAIERAIHYPDRLGGTSDDPVQRQGGYALLRLALRELEQERRRERASALGLFGRFRHAIESMVPDTGRWADESLVVQACSEPGRLVRSLRYHTDGGINTPGWLKPELVRVLGAGVVAVALDRAKAEEDYPPVAGFFGVYEAEIAWERGDERRALEIARRAFEALPEAEALLRAQVAILAGQAAWELDERSVAYAFYERAIQLDPGSLRRRRVALPAQISLNGRDEVIAEVDAALARSPRLADEPGGFQVAISGGENQIEICLRSPVGNRIRCVPAKRPANEAGEPVADDDFVIYAVDQFHRHMFAMRMGDTNLDLSSLDGSTIQNQTASERMEELLEGI